MRSSFYTLIVSVLPFLTVAQTNYIANTATVPNSATNTVNTTLVGVEAGNLTMTGDQNTFVGRVAGQSTTTGGFNTFVGTAAGQDNTGGFNNVFVGTYAGQSNTGGSNNSFMGYNAGATTTNGINNTFLGAAAGFTNGAGNNNTLVGYHAGYANTSGASNTFMGYNAGLANTIGANNVFTGYHAGNSNTTGSQNIFVGYRAGYNNSTGSNNIIIGPNSGTLVTTSDDNVLMGYNVQAEEGVHHGTAIGADARVAVSHAVILGNQANVGIGTSAPTARLHVRGEQLHESGVRFEQLTSQSPVSYATDAFLTVNEQGDVVKGRYQLRISQANAWSDKVFASDYTLRPLASVAAYIDQQGHLPGVPTARQMVEEGVDLARMNAILLEKIEELTLYTIQLEKADQLKNHKLQELQVELDTLKQLVHKVLEKK
ncbi:hypothetical protein [Spirosoma gilvum]